MDVKLHQNLELRLKLSLNLLLKQQVEVLTLQVQELEKILNEEALSNPFVKGVFRRIPSGVSFEEKEEFQIPYTPSELEEIERNVRAEFEGKELDIALELLRRIDERGFLRQNLGSVARELGVSEEVLEEIRKRIVSLDPLGVCCRDVWEFLRVQIEEVYPEERDYLLQELESLRQGGDISEEAKQKISRLRLSPLLSPEPVYRIAKVDAVIEEDGNDLVVYLYEDFIEVDLNEEYLELYRRARGKVKGFLREAYERYEALRKALSIRRENLRKILEIVRDVQEDFLRGRGNLRSLSLKDVAGELGVHESTVSRIINSKYVKTPVGTYPLRFFFVRETAGGLSQDELMSLIKEIIESEDPRKPYSDEQIARILRERGLKVARRTVTKYREMLGIPSSRERRTLK
ncbi:MAG: RNA polymerase factor sigma-54 [Aquificae bacterium]|nr:RNA polymerase factor sigma-54 [Aquificota bacterium]